MSNIETKRAPRQEMPGYHEVRGVGILVEPGVLPPGSGARFLAANIHISPGQRFLDLQTGPGTLAIIASMQWASGLAVDEDPEAVKNAQKNFHRHNVRAQAIQGDLFVTIPEEERFDQIYAVLPDLPEEADQFAEKLLPGTVSRLKPGGVLLAVLSAGHDLEHFVKLAHESGLAFVISDETPDHTLFELRHESPKPTDVV